MKRIINRWITSRNYKWLIKYHHGMIEYYKDYLHENLCRLMKLPESKQFIKDEITNHENEVKRLVAELENI